jgi:ATP-dependent RNA helicase HrpB
MRSLPIDPLLPGIAESLGNHPNLVIEAPPGAGKTTRVPPALSNVTTADVLVLEPRRLAARMAARRVAQERGERLGETIGYQVRFEEVAGPRTRLRFLTEGVLTRRFLSDPELACAGIVILDEFHERHLDTDIALALLRRLQQTTRPDLRIVAMSATPESKAIAAYLGDCPILRSEGRLFPVAIEYTPHSPDPLEQQVARALERLVTAAPAGCILVFLPGAAEIRRAARACQPIADRAGLLTLSLHGDLSPAEQDRAVQPADRPKLILSTNIAESSITIDGVTAVIDSGLARIASDSPWTGLASLEIARISRASAKQRAGRAGRTDPGRVIRLYPEEDFLRRPEHDAPEIERRELSQTVLDLAGMGIRRLDWFEPPPDSALGAAEELLRRLNAIDPQGALTATGRKMTRLPLHPRLARLVVEAETRGAGEDGYAAAAVLSAGERLEGDPPHAAPSDLLVLIERDWQPHTKRIFDQIRRRARTRGAGGEQDLLIAILAAFPDRVARRRQDREYLLAGGGAAVVAPSSAVRDARLIVAVDVESRRDRGLPLIRLASAIEPEWLIDLFPERVEDTSGPEWNRTAERVDQVGALTYDGLAIVESRGGMPDPGAAARLLAGKALEADLGRFVDREELERFRARVAFASEHSSIPNIDDAGVRAVLAGLCEGKRSFAELASADLVAALRASLPDGYRLDEIAPPRLQLPNGRHTRVHYAAGQPPWIASRLQDFFGMNQTPRIAGVPVVAHLLAPNQRPVQMTSDLAGFWERLYPQLRRELSRRYPRHKWPELQ